MFDVTNEAKRVFDPTKPVQTRDGRSARIVCNDRVSRDGPIFALVMFGKDHAHGGAEYALSFYSDGYYIPRGLKQRDHPNDLVNIPVVRYEYQNVVKTTHPVYLKRNSSVEETLQLRRTQQNADTVYIGLVRYTFTDDVLTNVELVDGKDI